MPLYRCEKCGCVENTASGHFYGRDEEGWPIDVRGKALCSACAPATGPDGLPTGFGQWHGMFPRGQENGMLIDQSGFLWSRESKLPASVRIVGEVY